MSTIRRKESGMALILVMVGVVVVLGALGVVMTQVQSAKKESDHAVSMVLLEEASQAGIDMAYERLWDNYIQTSGNTTRNWASFRYYLNNDLEIPINEDLNFNGAKDPDEVGNGDSTFDVYPMGYDRRGKALLEDPLEFSDPDSGQVLATLASVHVARYDEWSQAHLTITSTAVSGDTEKTAVQVMTIGAQRQAHPEYPILANNISCILCHAEILSLPLALNTDSDKYGSFDRIKVASLESMLVRKSEAASNVAGTVYTRGKVYKQNGSEFSASDLQNSNFKAYAFSDENGKILQNDSGNMTKTSLVNAETGAGGDLEQFANLYMDYPEDEDQQTDGTVPNSFPSPYPDENNNRMVDDDEFEVIVNSANGRLDFAFASEEEGSGEVDAGVAFGVPEGSVYDGTALPELSNGALSSLQTGSYDGNLILVGTDDDPITINKTVAVDGDLVITGSVKGYGQLLVSGNVYITGDVTYADAPGEFGVDADGNENAFALIAGGSIMMGDYLTVRGVNHSAKNNDKYPTWSQYSIHARSAHRSNNVNINWKTETLEWGYFDKDSVDAGGIVEGRQGQQYSFTTSELMLFNNMELEKALADSEYVPRFYGLRESQPNNIYLYDSGDEHSVRYTESGVKLLSDYIVEEGLPLDVLDRAVYQYCSPEQNWISEDTLRQIWFDDEMTRPSSGRPFQFDGLLYSNNSIWCIVRSKTRHNSYTNGEMRIRGGVIAADLGIFVPGNGSNVGLSLYYDPRVQRFFDVTDTNNVVPTRTAFYYQREAA